MREKIRDVERLVHIRTSIQNIFSYLSGRDKPAMKADKMCYHAVVYNIMIIGEAANMFTKEFRDTHPETPWRDIVDMRNVLVHGYYVASPEFIWETYEKDLPPLLEQTERYIQELTP
ncbi:MAG: DUF86 domain-containing protein [Bacteroidaceae bacterium]|nr:DUF86 domain-containing protein [Bacteroidaceae bacterium]